MASTRQRRPSSGERLTAKTVQGLMHAAEGQDRQGHAPSANFRKQFIGQITSTGPNGEPDFCGPMYWVKIKKLFTEDIVCDEMEPPPPPPCEGDDCDDPPPPPPCIGSECDDPPMLPPGGPFRIYPGCHGIQNPWWPYFAEDGPCTPEAHGPPDERVFFPNAGDLTSPEPNFGVQAVGIQAGWVDYQSSSAPWIPAINILEVAENTHTLEPGLAVIVFEMTNHEGKGFAAFYPGGSGGGSGGTLRVMIERVIAQPEDAILTSQQANFGIFGPHLSCFRVAADNTPILTERVAVLPPGHKTADQFKFGKAHIYDIVSQPFPPIFTAIKHQVGWTLAFAEAQLLTAPPDRDLLCVSNIAEGTGACCHFNLWGMGYCVDLPGNVCLEQGGVYAGDGTTCSRLVDWHMDCGSGGEDIHELGSCCCLNLQEGTTVCRNTAQGSCDSSPQFLCTFHPGVFCTSDECTVPGDSGADTGACCTDQQGCINVTEDECFGLYNGMFMGVDTECTIFLCNPEIGACCGNFNAAGTTCVMTLPQFCCNDGTPGCIGDPVLDPPVHMGPGSNCDACP